LAASVTKQVVLYGQTLFSTSKKTKAFSVFLKKQAWRYFLKSSAKTYE
jgi:hypothetical protein